MVRLTPSPQGVIPGGECFRHFRYSGRGSHSGRGSLSAEGGGQRPTLGPCCGQLRAGRKGGVSCYLEIEVAPPMGWRGQCSRAEWNENCRVSWEVFLLESGFLIQAQARTWALTFLIRNSSRPTSKLLSCVKVLVPLYQHVPP